MKRWIAATALALSAATALAGHHEKGEGEQDADAQEAAMMEALAMAATPGDPHAELAKGVGRYRADMAMYMGPGAEAMQTMMTVERTMDLDGRVLVEDWEGEFMGTPFKGQGRTGYDNVSKRYWSTWSDNLSTGVLVMYGDWDEEQQALVFTGESINPMTGKPYTMRSVGKRDGDIESMVMFEDHGDGEYKSMSFTLTPL